MMCGLRLGEFPDDENPIRLDALVADRALRVARGLCDHMAEARRGVAQHSG